MPTTRSSLSNSNACFSNLKEEDAIVKVGSNCTKIELSLRLEAVLIEVKMFKKAMVVKVNV